MQINDKKFNVILANSGMTINQAAKIAGISAQRYRMILNQKRATLQAVGKIARSLGVDVTEIIDMD